jgi:Uma2 family endonuclease
MYARHGVKPYWVLDPAAESLAEFRLDERAYELVATHSRGDVFQAASIDGLAIPLDEVFGSSG